MAKKKQVQKGNNKQGQYDWFKNGSQNSTASSPKGSFKVAWKFIKIFLFISLLGFTLTGCIQSFVFKTDTSVGRSVEIYANNDEVAPHSTTINVAGKPGERTLSFTEASHWVNEKDAPGVLDKLRKEVALQNGNKNLKLKDAWHGSNEVVRVTENGVTKPGTDSIVQLNNKPLIISSEATKFAPSIVQLSTLNPPIGSPAGSPAKRKIVLYNSYALTRVHKLVELIFTDVKATNNKTYKARDAFNTNLFARLLENPIISDSLTYKPQPGSAGLSSEFNTSPTGVKNLNNITRVTRNFQLLASMFRMTAPKLTKDSTDITFTMPSGLMINSGTRSAWRPLVTWGDAWHLGPFYAIFVYPIGIVTANMIQAMPFMDGWESLITIFIIVFVIKALSFLITFKSILQQTKMQELSAKKAVIDAKYANYKDNKQMTQRKNQEVQAMYKKEGVSPFGAMGAAFIVMPLFFSILRVTYALPHLKATLWLGMRFGATSWKELFHGEWQYLPLMALAVLFAAAQQLLPRLLTRKRDKNRINVHQKAAMKKSNKTQNIMIIVSIVASVLFSAGMQVYYLASGTWMIIQSFLTHHILVQQKKRRRVKKVKV